MAALKMAVCPPTDLNGVLGQPMSKTYAATGGVLPYTWSLSDALPLPPGLSLDPATGIISGIPSSVAGGIPIGGGKFVFGFHLLVTDSVGAFDGCFLGSEGGTSNFAVITSCPSNAQGGF